jgi:hypothetical protein
LCNVIGCQRFKYFGQAGEEGYCTIGFWYYIAGFAWCRDAYTACKFPGIRKGRVLEEGIKEVGKGMWEGQVEVSDDIVCDAILARGGGVVQLLDEIVDFSDSDCFVCSMEVDILLDKIGW